MNCAGARRHLAAVKAAAPEVLTAIRTKQLAQELLLYKEDHLQDIAKTGAAPRARARGCASLGGRRGRRRACVAMLTAWPLCRGALSAMRWGAGRARGAQVGQTAAGLVDDAGVDALAAPAPEPLAHQRTAAPLCQPQARRVRRVPTLPYAHDERRRRGAGLVEDKEMDDLTKLLDHKLKDLHYHPPAFHAAMPQPAQLLFDHPMFADVPDAEFHAQARHALD